MSDYPPITNESGDLLQEVPATTVQKIAAEILGTLVLVLFGTGVATVLPLAMGLGQDNGYGSWVIATALAFGLSVVAMAYAVGRISGGHFNPAITLGAALGGRLSWVQAAVYMAAQVVGAIIGSFVLWVVLKGSDFDVQSFGANGFGDQSHLGVSLWAVLILEIVLTFIFVMVVLGATDRRTKASLPVAGLAIGLSLTLIHLLAIPLDGTSVNPARSLSAALFSGSDAMGQVWLFLVAPLIGGAIAGLVYPILFGRDADPVPGSGLNITRPQQPNAYYGSEQQWGQQGGQQGWNAPQQPGQQQWGQQEGWANQPQQPQPGQQQWGQPGGGHAAPQPGQQPQQWGQPPAEPQPGQWGQPGGQPGGQTNWGDPGEDDGRTQLRPDS